MAKLLPHLYIIVIGFTDHHIEFFVIIANNKKGITQIAII